MRITRGGLLKKTDADAAYQAVAGSALWGLGDSITRRGVTDPAADSSYQFDAQSYVLHAVLASNGRLKFGGVAAASGYRSDQVVAELLPIVLAASPKPAACVVHVGTNDIGILTQAQTIANLTTIFEALHAAGIRPIGTTLLPKHSLITSNAGPLQALTLWVLRYCRQRGFQAVDWGSQFTDPANGDWLDVTSHIWNADDVHPSPLGARLMGYAIADTIAAGTPYVDPPLIVTRYNNLSLEPSKTNGCFVQDTNADGVPDNWSVAGAQAGGAPPAGYAAALTDMSMENGYGKWFTLTRPTGAVDVYATSTLQTLVPGNRMLLGYKIKTSDIEVNGASFDLRITTAAADNDLGSLKAWALDIGGTPSRPYGLFLAEFVVPSGMSSNSLQMRLQLKTAACSVSIGQVTLYDLTAAGVL